MTEEEFKDLKVRDTVVITQIYKHFPKCNELLDPVDYSPAIARIHKYAIQHTELKVVEICRTGLYANTIDAQSLEGDDIFTDCLHRKEIKRIRNNWWEVWNK
ncbi:MAG: hypothetical protein ACXABY_03705 [Candidatus Thorarchaeota archaeon]